MASSSLGALIGPLFSGAGASAPAEKKRAAKKSKAASAPRLVAETPATYKPPSPAERMHDHARDAKVRATQDWVEGRLTTAQHEAVHKRAKHVLASREPKTFKGKTGEKVPKKGRGGVW